MRRNPPWTRDELILALDVYVDTDFPRRPEAETRHAILTLSEVLNRLPIHMSRPDAARFRNAAGVSMKLRNFLALDPSASWEGLGHGSALDKEVWDEFTGDRARLHQLAEAIRAQLDDPATLAAIADDEDIGAPEGQILLRVHRARERDPSLVWEKKRRALEKRGVLECEACEFIFSERYGPLGDGFIECHHTVPVSLMRPGQRTRLADLALVCANCHRMLHRPGGPVTIAALRDLIASSYAGLPPIATDGASAPSVAIGGNPATARRHALSLITVSFQVDSGPDHVVFPD